MDDRAGTDPPVLSIGEVARRTGLPVTRLRSWEVRHGVPEPVRAPNGQRRYRETDCVLLVEVQRRRQAGQSLKAALAQASTHSHEGEVSIFAGLRHRHPDLSTHLVTKRVLSALSRAMEDECCARAQRPVLVGCFQHQRFYDAARARWEDLSGTAEQTIVMAAFEPGHTPNAATVEIYLDEGSPMRREWALICDSPDQAACLAGWEHPGQTATNDAERTFEVVWSVDPVVVRSALRIAIGLANADEPSLLDHLAGHLRQEVIPASADLQRTSGLFGRTLDYLT